VVYYQDRVERFSMDNMPNLYGIAALTASLPIFLLPLRARRSSSMSPSHEIQPRRLRQNREHPDLLLCPTTLPIHLDIHPTRSIL
jgi:hypothetical protein